MKKTHEAITGDGSALSKYQNVMIGNTSIAFLIFYEFCQLLTDIPGAPGMLLRKIFWPKMFASCGKGVTFGKGTVIRHPKRVHIGNSVIISEYCIIDSRHSSSNQAIILEDNVILSNNVMLSCKNGSIFIGKNVGVNAQTIIQSTNHCAVSIKEDSIIGQRCLIIGGGSYDISDCDKLIREQSIVADGGVTISNNVWLGGNVTVLGGVTMEEGSVAAAGAVVSRSIPPYSVCMGIPARVVKKRN